MKIIDFKDRQSTHPGRKKLTIISQTSNSMIVDEVFADGATQEGTNINAEIMLNFQESIVAASTNSTNALNISQTANIKSESATTTANNAYNNSLIAISKSEEALTYSTKANNKVNELESKLASQGATIRVNNIPVTTVDFASDPQTQITSIENNSKIISNNQGGFSCGTGAEFGTGFYFKRFAICDENGKIPVERLVDAIYPVGSIYMTTSLTNPTVLFGGNWEQLKDRFLLGGGGTYALDSIGGASTHTLTINELPSHRHGLSSCNADEWCDDYDWVKPLGNNGGGGAKLSGAIAEISTNTGMGQRYVSEYSAANSAFIMEAIGGGSAHNNMPPYLVVNIWKRIG